MLLYYSLAAGLSALTLASAQEATGTIPTDIIGTWVSKSNKTITGPGFYNPLKDEFIEPEKTGISYSFSSSGWYEEAYYRAISNPTNPACPSGILQWQHGTFVMNANGSLSLTPVAVDGRQLLSEPCDYDNGIYTRYNQSEYMKGYSVYVDGYHQVKRLDLSRFDGSLIMPLYLVYDPPQMLPTSTLHPATTSSTAQATGKAKRGIAEQDIPLPKWKPMIRNKQDLEAMQRLNANRVWWVGLAFTGIGGLLYFGPRRLGIRI